MTDELRVLLLRYPAEAVIDQLRGLLDDRVRITVSRALTGPHDHHILVTGRPTREELCSSGHLHTVIIPWSGLSEATREALREHPQLAVHNLHHNAAAAAEQAAALLLAAAKFIIPADRRLRQGDWSPRYRPDPTVLLEGKTAVVLGYGAVGRRVARMCRGLGMRVVAVRRTARPAERSGEDEVHTADALPNLLSRGNALIMCLPLTEETKGMLGARELALLPEDAVLVNIGRGATIDQGALYDALRSGRLKAAGLDVWYHYPADEAARSDTAPADRPFHELENVVMTPHRGGAYGTAHTEIMRMRALAALLNAAAAGQPMPNRVDLVRGY